MRKEVGPSCRALAVGPKPHELYGKFTWKIENFSETSKRELRSNVFDVGNYKWYAHILPIGPSLACLTLRACAQVHPRLSAGLRRLQSSVAVPVRGGLR